MVWLIGTVGNTVRAIVDEHGRGCDTFKLAEAYYIRKHDRYPMEEDEFRKLLLEEYRVILDHEYEYLMSDECVDENITSNGYEFTESGDFYC